MTTAWQIIVNGHGRCVVGTLERAFDHVSRHLDPGGAATFGRRAEFPALDAADCPGSYRHRLRYEVETRGFESYELVEHDLRAQPAHKTEIVAYDLAHAFDPCYLVQKHLYLAADGDDPVSELADRLERAVLDGVSPIAKLDAERRRDAVENLRRWERDLDGEFEVVPRSGDAGRILRDLPRIARAKFEALAAKAFPEAVAPRA